MKNRIVAAALAASIAAIPGSAFGIPNQHLNPHSDDPAKISWQQAAGVPDTTNHLHIEDVNITTIANTGFQHNGGDWIAEAAWDDRFLRFVDTAAGKNGIWDRFGHGFIDPNFRPRYLFAGDVPDAARLLVDDAMSLWDTRAKEEGEQSRTAPDGSALRTSVIFERVMAGAYELLVDFIEGFQEIATAAGEWLVSAAQIVGYPAGDTPNPRTLMFEATPTSELFVTQEDWKISTDGLALGDPNKVYQNSSNAFATNWSFDKTPGVLFDDQDIDYLAPDMTEYEGNEAAFTALGITVSDTWGGFPPLLATSTMDIYEADFYSVALHEWGHVIGLLHSNAGTMKSDAPFTMNHLTHSIDDNNAFGAAALYSIPAPAPGALALMLAGLGGVFAMRRRGLGHRRQSAKPLPSAANRFSSGAGVQ